jgi:hypothetical protein
LQKEACEQPDRKHKLEAALARVAGRPIRLQVALLPAEEQSPVEHRPRGQSLRQLMREKEADPWVRQAIELFDAEVTRVEPGRRGPPTDGA